MDEERRADAGRAIEQLILLDFRSLRAKQAHGKCATPENSECVHLVIWYNVECEYVEK